MKRLVARVELGRALTYFRARGLVGMLASFGALGGCTDRHLTAPLAIPSSVARTASPLATGSVTWLSPLGVGTADPTTLDATVAPQIQICVWVSGACAGAPIAQFAPAAAAGVGLITVNTGVGDYEASWSLLSASFTTRKTYRIRVFQGATETGAVSVDMVRGRWALTRTDGTLAPLIAANVLPIRFFVPLVDVTAVIGPSGGTMKLSDGAGLDVAPGVVEGNMTFRLSTLGGGGAGGGIALTAEHSQSLSVSGTTTPSDCVSYVTHQLTMVPGSGASFVSGNNAVTLRLPIPCSPAPNQSLYFSAQLDGVSTDILWKTAKSDVDRLTASTTLTGNQLLTLNTKASTTLSLLPVVVTAGDLLACTVGGKQYPALVKEPDANPATSRKYAVVLVHGLRFGGRPKGLVRERSSIRLDARRQILSNAAAFTPRSHI
jgi:hypothetical protein